MSRRTGVLRCACGAPLSAHTEPSVAFGMSAPRCPDAFCPICGDAANHAGRSCPSDPRDESESDSTDTVTALGMRSAFGEPR